MKVLSVTKSERFDGSPTQFVIIEASVETSDGRFGLDLNHVGKLLKRVVPFQRVLVDNHMISGFDADAVLNQLMRAAKIRTNHADVGHEGGLRYSLGISGLADAWITDEAGERKRLWKIIGPILTGPVPRHSESGAPAPVNLAVTIETLCDHYDSRLKRMEPAMRDIIRTAGYRIEAAFTNAMG